MVRAKYNYSWIKEKRTRKYVRWNRQCYSLWKDRCELWNTKKVKHKSYATPPKNNTIHKNIRHNTQESDNRRIGQTNTIFCTLPCELSKEKQKSGTSNSFVLNCFTLLEFYYFFKCIRIFWIAHILYIIWRSIIIKLK